MSTQPIMDLDEVLAALRHRQKFPHLSLEARELCDATIHHLEAGKRAECSCDMAKNYAHFALGGAFLGELEDAVKFCPWCSGTLSNHEQEGQQG